MLGVKTLLPLVACVLVLVLSQQNQQCQNHFFNSLSGCIQNASVNIQNLVHFTSNGSRGTAPTNRTAFKEYACKREKAILNCTIPVRDAVFENRDCPVSDKNAVSTFFDNMFGPYDLLCAHPCRFTFVEQIRVCYAKASINPDGVMGNSTTLGLNFLGNTTDEVKTLCTSRKMFVDCVKTEQLKCAESLTAMKDIGLDLNTMSITVEVLCSHPKVYVDSLSCFDSPTQDVRACVDNRTAEIMNLNLEQNPLSKEEFQQTMCGIHLRYMTCDLKAWKTHTLPTCNPAVIGMKTETDCKMVPPECRGLLGNNYKKVCAEEKWNTEQRENYDQGGNQLTLSSLCLVLSLTTVSIQLLV